MHQQYHSLTSRVCCAASDADSNETVEREEFAALILHMASADLRSKARSCTFDAAEPDTRLMLRRDGFKPQYSSAYSGDADVTPANVPQEVAEYWARQECHADCVLPED